MQPKDTQVTVTTTDATNQVYIVDTLSVANASVAYELTLNAVRSDATAVGYFKMWAAAARNAIGTGAGQQGQIGPNGSVDGAATPWTASGSFPATWAINASVSVAGDDVRIEFAGGVGETVHWTISVQRTTYSP